ncbi:JmjC domain-containing protein [Dokdonella sp.]|uniref:JmjC domain-containing protein n=1 Tax=Dokdonella sp. TaxID=2291710 RepID=UPI003783264C
MSRTPAIEVRAGKGRPLGMSPDTFLRDYWQKRPLLVRGAFTDFRNPVTPDDLAGLACEDLALSRIAIHEPKLDRWTLRSGPFAEGDFATLPKTHWTLLVQDVDKWDADVAALLGHFSFLPSWRVDDVMISYAEDGGSVGAHVDQYDVFLLQGLGRRHWQISTDAHAPKAFRDDSELKLLREFTPTHDWVLEPGDMLYLPPGVPHHGIAVGACMTYSVGMRAPSQADLLGDFVDHLIERLPEEARYTDADLASARGDGEIDDAAIARVAQAMPWLKLDTPVALATLRAWFGGFITRYRSAQLAAAPPRRLSDAMFLRAVASGASVRRNPWSRCAWMRDGRGAVLFVAGEGHACSRSLARTAGMLDEFPLATGNARDLALLRALVDAGHYALVHPRRSRSSR